MILMSNSKLTGSNKPNMQKTSSKTSIIVLVIVLIAGAGLYFYMSGTPADDGLLVEEGAVGSGDASAAGSRVLLLLNQISSLKIDNGFFASPVYSSLVDHTVPIYEQNVGKANPFYNPNPRPRSAAPAR